MITDNRQITEHFHSSEFRCQHCGNIYIQEELVKKMEELFKKLNASKCIISSGYRCREYDIQIGGFAGRHSEGLAADCVYYDENGNIIPSKIVICVAWDMKLLNGIANIDGNYSHLDNRKNGTYYGDEPRGNSSMWSNPYSYFGVSKEEVRQYTKEEEPSSNKVNVYYQVETKEDGVLPMVKNLEDYAGWSDHPIRYLAMKADKGGLKYRVTTTSGLTLPWVTECDINNHNTGCAGNGEPIATVEAYYYTPKDIIKESGYKYIYYKVNDYPYQKDLIKGNGFDGFAGEAGVTATKFQMYIGD